MLSMNDALTEATGVFARPPEPFYWWRPSPGVSCLIVIFSLAITPRNTGIPQMHARQSEAPMPAQADQELVERCLQGDESAWTVLGAMIERLTAGLVATGRLDYGRCDDVAQEVKAELLRDDCRALRRFEGRSRLTTYLGAIVVRVAGRLQQDDSPALSVEFLDGLFDGTGELLARVETWIAIEQTIAPINVLILRLETAGYTSEEIALMLNHLTGRPWTAAAVRQRRARVVRQLRRAILA